MADDQQKPNGRILPFWVKAGFEFFSFCRESGCLLPEYFIVRYCKGRAVKELVVPRGQGASALLELARSKAEKQPLIDLGSGLSKLVTAALKLSITKHWSLEVCILTRVGCA